MESVPERQQDSIVRLASLLEVDFQVAQKALHHCQWNFEAAVAVAFQLASTSSSAASSRPAALAIECSLASSAGQPSSSSSSNGPLRLHLSGPVAAASSPTSVPSVTTPLRHKRMLPSLSHDAPDVFVPATGSSKKKPRLGAVSSPGSFKILNNDADHPAANPPLFNAHPLREEQRRSLGWMMSQESQQQGCAGGDALLVKGGLLADRMGYGKTSTTIGLISLEVNRPLRQPGQQGVPLLKNDGYIPSDSTLIVCPSHLIDQWEGEFWKFLGPNGVQISKPRGISSNPVETLTHTFESRDDLRAQLGIKVTRTPSSWAAAGVGGQALIADVNPNSPIHSGDIISKIECTKLRCHDGRILATTSRAGFNMIDEVFRTKRLYDHRRVPRQYSLPDGTVRVRHESRRHELTFTDNSTVTLTIKRIKWGKERTEVVRGSGKGTLKVLTIRSHEDVELLKQQDFISRFHVVLASAAVHSDPKYAKFISDASGTSGLMGTKLTALGKKVKEWCQNQNVFDTQVLARSPALFEMNFWRRVICDEFHETQTWEYRVREMLRHLGATHKWGLSGTPPLGSAAAVAEVAGLLGYTTPSAEGDVIAQALHYGSSVRYSHPSSKEWLEDAQNVCRLKDAAAVFVEKYIRQNTSHLIAQIGIVEHEELVAHTSEERVIYRQACHDQGVFDLAGGYNHISLVARADLLKRCAHFDMGEAADSAGSAVTGLGDKKREWVDKVEKQLWLEVARARLLKLWESTGKDVIRSTTVQHPRAKVLIESILASSVDEVERNLPRITPTSQLLVSADAESGKLKSAMGLEVQMIAMDGSLRLRPEVRLVQPVRESEYYRNDKHRHAIMHAVARLARDHQASRVLADTAICEQACCVPVSAAMGSGLSELVTLFDKAQRSLSFYMQQVSILTQEQPENENECSICLESTSDIASVAILPCSHVFHSECIRAVLATSPYCPECRTPVQQSQTSSIVMELKPPDAPSLEDASGTSSSMSQAWKQNGSKLNAVANRLRKIREDDPTAKALVFVQWTDLETKVCRALLDHRVPFVCLSSDTRSRSRLANTDGAVLQSFQEDDRPDAPFVLVLSLQRAAAGTNLTAASHVLFVHPMNADSVQTAAAYERQALARVRRIGQTRKEVHVWRFVTQQTVEEHIWKLHRDAPEDAQADRVAVVAGES